MAQQILSTNTFTTAKWIVSSTASDGTHTTIASALTSASSGDTIFIRPGTFSESISLKAGVNLTAFESDSSLNGTGKVIISGTCTMTTAGTVTISGIQLQTNSAALLAVTGSAASVVNLNNCYLNCTNNSGITYSSSSGSSVINITRCTGDLGTTGIAAWVATGSGSINLQYTVWSNSGGSSTASTANPTGIFLNWCAIYFPLSFTSASSSVNYSQINSAATNSTCITSATSGAHTLVSSYFGSGSASALSIGASTTASIVGDTVVVSTNTNAVTGAGSVTFSPISMQGSSSLINTTTQTAYPITFASTGIAGSTSRSLSNFDQGTFTPVILGASTAGTGTYSTQTGRYQRVGRTVFVEMYIVWTAHTGTGIVQISGIPFAANAAVTGYPMQGVSIGSFLVATATQYAFYAVGGTSLINCYGYIVSTGTLVNSSLASNTNSQLFVSGSYEI